MYILGDLNCNLLEEKNLFNMPTNKLYSIYELYQLSQLINEPTRVTMRSSSLIDHVVTNTPEKISHSGVVHKVYSGAENHLKTPKIAQNRGLKCQISLKSPKIA